MLKRWLTLAVLAVMLPAAGASDWPEFRGPTGQGLAEGRFPVEWGPAKHVAWKKPVPGQGWSSPVVWRGRVYLTAAVPAAGGRPGDFSLRALCLDAATGQTAWDVEALRESGAASPPIHSKNSHASPTPVTDGERLYVHFGHQGTACLDLGGRVLWRQTGLRYQPVHGNGGSPVLVNDLLVFSIDGSDRRAVVALDRKTGKVRWQAERPGSPEKGFSFSTPLVITVNGRQQVVSPGSEVVTAHDPADGRELWRVRYEGYSVVPRPVFGHGLVFLSTGYERPEILAIRPDGQGDVTETHVAWRLRRGAPNTPSPLLVGEELYLVSDGGIASCVDAKTGRVHWQERIGGNYSASPMHADGKVYFQGEDGVGTVVRAGRQFEVLARNRLEERTLASLAAADGAIFLRTEKQLYKIQFGPAARADGR